MNPNKLRRKDRQMSTEEAYTFLKTSPFVFLSTTNPDGTPYCVPINIIVTDEKTAYFHGLSIGQKIENITANPNVCISCASSAGTSASTATKEGFILGFKSVVAFGTVSQVFDVPEKEEVLSLLCEQYVDPSLEAYKHISESIQRSLKITAVYKIDISSFCGKQNPN